MSLPFWIATEQADRMKAALEAEGFTDIKIAKGHRGGEIIFTASDNGAPFNVSAMGPLGLEIVIPRFIKWREQRNG